MIFETNNLLAPRQNICKPSLTAVAIVVCFIIFLSQFPINIDRRVFVISIDGTKPDRIVDTNFLSVAIDSSVIAENFTNLNLTNARLIKMAAALSPGYLRIGGTMADRLLFVEDANPAHVQNTFHILDGGLCTSNERECYFFQNLPNFTINGRQWLELNRLAARSNLKLLFDLNALVRFDNNSWNYQNAEQLIQFSQKHNLSVNWELGNEPNSFFHHFNQKVPPDQLAEDFNVLRTILNKYPKYQTSKLVGPDVTRPRVENRESQIFLHGFLAAKPKVSAVTFHQYYFDGRTAKPSDFVNPDIFDVLKWQINRVRAILDKEEFKAPLWLGETSSAYGGGTSGLSDTFLASFIWLDKLGVAAKFGVDLVVRQTLFGGSYALIDYNYDPAPDWWVSLIYKRLVGAQVVDCSMPVFVKLRFYCQCARSKGKVIVFGMNLSKVGAKIRIEEGEFEIGNVVFFDAYILTVFSTLDSKKVFLNGKLLKLGKNGDVPILKPANVSAYPHLFLPAYSLGFWVVPTDYLNLC